MDRRNVSSHTKAFILEETGKIEFQKAYIFLHKICNVRKKDWGLYTLLNQRALKGRTNALAYLMSLSRNLNSKGEQMWWYVRNFV